MSWAKDNAIRALCFDIDGTFYPKWQTDAYLVVSALSHPVFSLHYNSMRRRMRAVDGYEGGRVLSREEFRRKEMTLLSWRGCYDDYVEKYERCMKRPWDRAMKGILKCHPGVRQALERARAEGFLLAALSDFPISDKLEVLGLEGLFDFVASSEDFGYLKPNEVPFNAMLKALDVRPDEALYVGDSYRKDIVGGARIGMRTMLVSARTGREPHPMADLVLTSWRSFARMVLE